MQAATSLLDFILNLLKDPQAQAEFQASPEQVLTANGLTGVCAADIHETLPLVTDHRAVELASTSHSVPLPVVPAAGESGIHGAIQYLHHITCTYRYDDHGAHTHDAGHENIWAASDVTHGFDGTEVAPDGQPPVAGGHFPGAVAPSPGGAVDTGNWAGNSHGNAFGQGASMIYGDHTNGPIYGDTPDDRAGNSSGSDLHRHLGYDQGDGLHNFGSGAPTSPASGTGSPVAYSDDTRGSYDSTRPGHPEDSGNAASQGAPDDSGHSHDAHGVLGDSYYDQGGEHDGYDDHGYGLHLDLH